MEAACRTALAKGEVGIIAPKAAPLFSELATRFLAHVETRHENKPQTIVFYASKLNRLLSYEPLRGVRADRIDEGLIEGYVVARRASVGPATVNRELATLRRILRLAYEWREIQRAPRIRLLNGERTRDFVLSRKQEQMYLAACPQPLHDIAVLMLETGLRIGEALNLEWTDVILEPIKGSRFGFLRVREGKSKKSTPRGAAHRSCVLDTYGSPSGAEWAATLRKPGRRTLRLNVDQSSSSECRGTNGGRQTPSALRWRFCPALASSYHVDEAR